MNKLIRVGLLLGVLLAGSLPGAAQNYTQRQTPAPVFTETGTGVFVEWQNVDGGWSQWSTVEIGGVQIPAYLFTVQIRPAARFEIVMEQTETRPWRGNPAAFTVVDAPIPRTVDGDERPDLRQRAVAEMPGSPLMEVRRGRARGVDSVVMALLPVIETAAGLQEVVTVRVWLRGATLAASLAPRRFGVAVPPPAPVSRAPAAKILVTHAGIQEISTAALRAADLINTDSDLRKITLWREGDPIAVELLPDGLRFYAPAVGDRWNQGTVYWASLGETPSPHMGSRAALTQSITAASTQDRAWEEGEWYAPTRYDSLLPGPDGDHWFAADLRAGPDLPAMPVTATLLSALPVLTQSGIFTVTGTAYTSGQHNLQVNDPDGAARTRLTWQGKGDWQHAFALTNASHQLVLTLAQSTRPDGIQIDRLQWQRPAQLTFGARGAAFFTTGAPTRYQLDALPPAFALYDVTDPALPLRVDIGEPRGSPVLLDSASSRYLLVSTAHSLYLPLIGGRRVR